MPPTYLSRVKPTATYLASWMFKCLSSAQHSIFYPQNLPKSALFIVLIWLIIFKASTLPILYLMETTLLFLRFRVCCHYLHVAYTVSYARILSHRNPFPLLVQSYLHDFIYTVFFIQYNMYKHGKMSTMIYFLKQVAEQHEEFDYLWLKKSLPGERCSRLLSIVIGGQLRLQEISGIKRMACSPTGN